MALILRQSTAVDIAIGPFVNLFDGNTAETGLTITQPDIRIKKNGESWVQKNAAQTLVHEENGWYEVHLDATDTDTLGILTVAVHKPGALPVWERFMVISANVYDSLFSTDKLQVDVVEWRGELPNALQGGRVDSLTGAMAAGVLTATAIADGAITAAKFAANALDAVWSASNRTLTSFGSLVSSIWSNATRTLTSGDNIVLAKGTGITGFNDLDFAEVQAAAAAALVEYDPPTNAEMVARTLPSADYFNPTTDVVNANVTKWLDEVPLGLSSGRLQVDLRAIDADTVRVDELERWLRLNNFASASFTATAATDTTVTPDAASFSGTNLTAPPSLDDFYRGAILFVNDASLGLCYPRRVLSYDGATGLITVDRPFEQPIDILNDSFVILPAPGSLTTNVAEVQAGLATPEDVNAQVLDVMTVDEFAEPTGVPAATSSLKEKIGWLFALARNRRLTTGSVDIVRNDADDADLASANLSDDGTTFERGKWS